MAGRRVELFGKRTFDLSPLATATSMSVDVVPWVSTGDDEEGVLLVRVHAIDIASGEIIVKVVVSAPSVEDPTLEFLGDDPASIELSGVAPALEVAAFSLAGIAGLRVQCKFGQGVGGAALSAELSAELVLKRSEA